MRDAPVGSTRRFTLKPYAANPGTVLARLRQTEEAGGRLGLTIERMVNGEWVPNNEEEFELANHVFLGEPGLEWIDDDWVEPG